MAQYEIIFCSSESEAHWVEDKKAWPHSITKDIEQLKDDLSLSGNDYEVHESSMQHGADFLTIAFVVTSLFMLGKKIEENLDAWISLGKRTATAVNKLRKHRRHVYLSEMAASAFVFDIISSESRHDEVPILVNVNDFGSLNPNLPVDLQDDFRSHPERYYVSTWIIGNVVHVVGMASTGKVHFHEKMTIADFWNFGSG